MTIGENMFLGNERGHKYKINWNETNARAAELLKTVGLKEGPQTLIKDIGVGKQQLVEIAKALAKNAKLLILDEPTASLNETDSKALLDLMLELKKKGMTSIIISHKLNEISYVADKITVIRDGSTIETLVKGKDDITESRIIKGMDKSISFFFCQFQCKCTGFIIYIPMKDHLCPIVFGTLYLDQGCGGWHDDDCFYPIFMCCIGNALSMVSCRSSDQPFASLFFRQCTDLIISTTHLICSCTLHIFRFKINLISSHF